MLWVGEVYIVVSAKNAYRDMFGKTSLELGKGLAHAGSLPHWPVQEMGMER